MKKITLLFLLITSFISFGQEYFDMTKELENINGHLTIDGNALKYRHNTREQIIITGKDLVLNDRSSFTFNNVILQLTGKIIVKGKVKPVLIDSYIFCADSGAMKSDRVIETDSLEDIRIADASYIQKLKGNPEISIYSPSGTRIFKGTKNEAKDYSIPISRYDVKVVGVGFKDNVLFTTN